MRITMVSLGSTGDVRPFILLGRELKRRGHRITIGAFTDFQKSVTEAGLEFYPIAGDAKDLMSHLMSPDAKGAAFLKELDQAVKQIAPVLLDDITLSCEHADALICNFFGSLYYSVAGYWHIPCIQVQYTLMDPNSEAPISALPAQHLGRGWNRFTYSLGYLLISLLEKKYLTPWRKKYDMPLRGLYTSPKYTTGAEEIPVVYELSEILVPRPRSFGSNITFTGFWSEEPEPYTPEPGLAAFMEAGEKPVYIGFGSMVSGNMQDTIDAVIDGVEKSGLRAVISLGWANDRARGRANDRMYFVTDVPHSYLFPRVQAVVHHGGAGTTFTGLMNGKPTLIIPFGGDQPFWGERVRALKCGPRPIPRGKLTGEKLAAALQKLTRRPIYRENAEAIALRLQAEPGLTRAADFVESWLEEKKQ